MIYLEAEEASGNVTLRDVMPMLRCINATAREEAIDRALPLPIAEPKKKLFGKPDSSAKFYGREQFEEMRKDLEEKEKLAEEAQRKKEERKRQREEKNKEKELRKREREERKTQSQRKRKTLSKKEADEDRPWESVSESDTEAEEEADIEEIQVQTHAPRRMSQRKKKPPRSDSFIPSDVVHFVCDVIE